MAFNQGFAKPKLQAKESPKSVAPIAPFCGVIVDHFGDELGLNGARLMAVRRRSVFRSIAS